MWVLFETTSAQHAAHADHERERERERERKACQEPQAAQGAFAKRSGNGVQTDLIAGERGQHHSSRAYHSAPPPPLAPHSVRGGDAKSHLPELRAGRVHRSLKLPGCGSAPQNPSSGERCTCLAERSAGGGGCARDACCGTTGTPGVSPLPRLQAWPDSMHEVAPPYHPPPLPTPPPTPPYPPPTPPPTSPPTSPPYTPPPLLPPPYTPPYTPPPTSPPYLPPGPGNRRGPRACPRP